MAACIAALQDQGWVVSAAELQEIFDDLTVDEYGNPLSLKPADLCALLLNVDLHLFGESCLKGELSSRDKLILQIDKIRNVAKPKISEDSGKESERLLRLTLTDGQSTVNALEMSRINGLSTKTPPGTKILIFPRKINIERNFLILTDANCQIVGGQVKEMIEKWRANEDARYKPRTAGGSCAPPWVPFGSKVDTSYLTKGFAAMAITQQSTSNAPVSEEFEQARKAVIAQAQSSGEHKTFGSAPVTVPQTVDRNPAVNARNYFAESNSHEGAAGAFRGRGGGRGRGSYGRPAFRGRGRGGRR